MSQQSPEPQAEWIPVKEAMAILGVSQTKMASLIKEGTLASRPSVLDKRVTLVKRSDVEKLKAQG